MFSDHPVRCSHRPSLLLPPIGLRRSPAILSTKFLFSVVLSHGLHLSIFIPLKDHSVVDVGWSSGVVVWS
ncbi:unnamed protein product [Linum trigynum]|uniref:Uncharacterized protein n=1 Tax=Linum trigynum TaxID=586398 RepID=A0AAV2FZ86_9ROSI